MASFGRYQTVRELHRTGFTVVYSGRAASAPAEKFAIKAFQPSTLLLEKEQAETKSGLFLNSAAIQQKAAAGSAQHWAPIYESGVTADGTFYVTDKYDRSLQQLFDGRIRLTAQALRSIVESVAKGLIELKQACRRPHGNLKATNILIAGTGEISQTKVVLADPLPDEHIDAKLHWNTDLRAIAGLIYQLVVQRPSPTVDGWQVPDSKEWATLGRQANDWRDLCNRLLNVHVKPGTMTIETLIDELAQFKKAKPLLSVPRLIAAGLIVGACVVILVMFWPKPPPEKAEWQRLCQEYLDWVGPLYGELGFRGSSERVERWCRHADLKKIVEKVKKHASYPYKMSTGTTVESIIDADVAQLKKLGATSEKTKKGLEAIQDIKSFFDPNSVDDPNSYKAWPLLTDIQNAANSFKERGWQRPAAYLQELGAKVKPRPGNHEIAENVDAILDLNREGTLKKINSSLEGIAQYQEAIKGSGDPILAKFDDDYVNKEVTSSEDIIELHEKLSQIADLSGKLAAFVQGDWQSKVDQETFFSDHKNDPVTTLTNETFIKRLDIIKGYYSLHPDPRDELSILVGDIEKYMPLASASNPVKADECAEDFEKLRPNLDTIRNKKGIEKNRPDITNAVTDYKPKLNQLLERVVAAAETAADYQKRIKKQHSTAKAEEIKAKWLTLRNSLLDKYPLPAIEKNLALYSDLRERIDDTNDNLLELDEELQKELPSQISAELKEKDWNNKLRQFYDRQRKETINRIVKSIPLQNEIPDINAPSFRDLCRTQFAEFRRRGDDLVGILAAFNQIEDGLEDCRLLDDTPPRKDKTLRSLWDRWKDTDIIKEPTISRALAELTNRIRKLEQVEKSDNRQTLVDVAFDSASQTETVYAAWIRLGRLSEPTWPAEYQDLDSDRKIRSSLKTKFETIDRRNDLLKSLAATGLKRETIFIEKNRAEDKVLAKFAKFAAQKDRGSALSQLQTLEDLARDLADFLAGRDWQNDKIRKDLFWADTDVTSSDKPVTMDTVTDIVRDWLRDVQKYRTLEDDPRNRYSWNKKIEEVEQLIHKGLYEQTALTEENSAKLRQENSRFTNTVRDVKQMRELPAIQKNKEKLSAAACDSFWKRLLTLEEAVRSIIKPPYCNRIDMENSRLIFATNYLHPNFEPVDPDNKEPVIIPGGWDQIRQAVREKQRKWLDFFYTIDGNDTQNVGWPKYIRSKKDLSVILRFIPAAPANPEPLYIATLEITNTQYAVFLGINGAKALQTARELRFVDQNNNRLISSRRRDDPVRACKITWNDSKNAFVIAQGQEDVPVTWVTCDGAKSYARWLGAELPTASQHEYASRAGTDTIYPWPDDPSQIANHAHLRADAWRKAAIEYNSKIEDPLKGAPPPVGAVKPADFLLRRTPLDADDVDNIAITGPSYNSAWPIAGADEPNRWGLYDMMGNVWEWCENGAGSAQPVICGGSCLSPPEYARPESKYVFQGSSACDVGFRIIASAR